jgi:hypothetical protein
MKLVSRFLLLAASVLIMASFITFIACSAAPGGGSSSSSASSYVYSPVAAFSNLIAQTATSFYMAQDGTALTDNGTIVTNGSNVGVMVDATSVIATAGGSMPCVTPQWNLLQQTDMSHQNFVFNFDIYVYSNTYVMLTNTNGGQFQWILENMIIGSYVPMYSTNLASFITGPNTWCHVSSPVNTVTVTYYGSSQLQSTTTWDFAKVRFQLATPVADAGTTDQYIIANLTITNTN